MRVIIRGVRVYVDSHVGIIVYWVRVGRIVPVRDGVLVLPAAIVVVSVGFGRGGTTCGITTPVVGVAVGVGVVVFVLFSAYAICRVYVLIPRTTGNLYPHTRANSTMQLIIVLRIFMIATQMHYCQASSCHYYTPI